MLVFGTSASRVGLLILGIVLTVILPSAFLAIGESLAELHRERQDNDRIV